MVQTTHCVVQVRAAHGGTAAHGRRLRGGRHAVAHARDDPQLSHCLGQLGRAGQLGRERHHANPAACQMYGYPHDEFVGLSGRDFVHPDSLPVFQDCCRKIHHWLRQQ
ncbi:MAG: PAS domain-containing protein [Chloroflexia bacterium]|nr:PAS domain-containing protein [Chloroflexia bacterium]